MTKTFKILAGLTIGLMAALIGYTVYLFSEKNKQRTANARAARWSKTVAPDDEEDDDEDEDEAAARAEAEAEIKNLLQNGN